jgi:hypothetical protein
MVPPLPGSGEEAIVFLDGQREVLGVQKVPRWASGSESPLQERF